MRSLKSQILTLWCRGRSYDEIVAELGCSRDYVRASVSRAKHGGRTPGDHAHNERQRLRYQIDEAFRAANRDRYRERWSTDLAMRQRSNEKRRLWYLENREHQRATERARYARKKAERATAPLGGSRAVKTQDATGQVRARRSETH
jgi:hypothetical protein